MENLRQKLAKHINEALEAEQQLTVQQNRIMELEKMLQLADSKNNKRKVANFAKKSKFLEISRLNEYEEKLYRMEESLRQKDQDENELNLRLKEADEKISEYNSFRTGLEKEQRSVLEQLQGIFLFF